MPDPYDLDWGQEGYTEAGVGGAAAGYSEAELAGAAGTPTPPPTPEIDAATLESIRRQLELARVARDRAQQAKNDLRTGMGDNPTAAGWAALDAADQELKRAQKDLDDWEATVRSAERTLALRVPKAPKTAADLAKEAYDEAAYKAKLEELGLYGLKGRPKAPTVATSSPASWAQAQEAAAQGRFQRETEFPWKKDVAGQERTDRAARLAQEAALAREGRESDWRRAQLQASEGLFGSMAGLYPKMAAAAPLPGQEYHLGYEPGGAMADIARRGRFGYDPEQYRIGTKTFDPVEWWRLAQQMGKGG